MKKRNCCFISVSPNQSAISNHFLAMAKHFSELDHEVVLLFDGKRFDLENHDTNPFVYSWPSNRPVKIHDAIFLFRLIRKYRPTCLIANFSSVNIMMIVGWLTRVPIRVAWYHTLLDQIKIDSKLSKWKTNLLISRKKWIYKLASNIIANSGASSQDVQKVYNVPSQKVKVFRYSLPDALADLGEINKPDVFKIICVGRLQFSKGQDVLLKAISLLKKEGHDLQVEFVGDGDHKQYYIEMARNLEIDSVCTFTGWVSHDDVLKKFATSSVAIVPSRSEAFGLVNIEALSVGVPVIASNVDGIAEIIRDSVDGFLFNPGDFSELAEKIKILIQNEVLCGDMGNNARVHFIEDYEREKLIKNQVDRILELYL